MFTDTDFDIFLDPTLDGRMDKIRSIIDPKFENFAQAAMPILQKDGDTWFYHIAKHKMRKTNAPDNTWIAFSTNKRGYKMLPHFEFGLWEDNIYLYLAIEENMKPDKLSFIVPRLKNIRQKVATLPKEFVLSASHMSNQNLEIKNYSELVDRYQNIKKSEVLIGTKVDRKDKIIGTDQLKQKFLASLNDLLPLYKVLN